MSEICSNVWGMTFLPPADLLGEYIAPRDVLEWNESDGASTGNVTFTPSVDALDLLLESDSMVAAFAAERLRRLQAIRREAFARDAARGGRVTVEITLRSLRLEVAAALRITEYAAGAMIELADAVVTRYPAVIESLTQGRMTERHAELLVTAVDEVPADARGRVLERGIVLAESLPVGQFRRAMRTLVDTERQATLAERHAAAVLERRVVVEPAGDGMAWLMALLPEVEARAVYGRVTAIAKVLGTDPEDARNLDQRRADALCDLLIDGETECHPSQARGIRATVAVTVPVLTLLGHEGGLPSVEGIGPIPVEKARELCGGADGWLRVLTHPETGMVLSVGRDQYRPPPMLRKLLRWRAERCMAPGCGVPASRCEIDHTLAWEHGGATMLENLAPLCKGHHTLKHHGGWRVEQVADGAGALEWTSPAGRRYVVTPERPVPRFRRTEPPPY